MDKVDWNWGDLIEYYAKKAGQDKEVMAFTGDN